MNGPTKPKAAFLPPGGGKKAVRGGQGAKAMPESIVNPDADHSIEPGHPDYDAMVRERKAFVAGFRLGWRRTKRCDATNEEVLEAGFKDGVI